MKRSQRWITEHFEELVTRYGGHYIAVAGEQVLAVALTPLEALEKAKPLAPEEEEISLVKVPREEELVCIL